MGKRKIPSKEKIIEEILNAVKRSLKIESQEELCEIVLRILKRQDKNYSLSPQRVKRLALTIPGIEVKAETKKSVRLKKIDNCPVCKSMIAELKGRNLLNQEMIIGFKCVNCAYQSDLEAFMPMKYSFVWKI